MVAIVQSCTSESVDVQAAPSKAKPEVEIVELPGAFPPANVRHCL
jgi:hypothetical protein